MSVREAAYMLVLPAERTAERMTMFMRSAANGTPASCSASVKGAMVVAPPAPVRFGWSQGMSTPMTKMEAV